MRTCVAALCVTVFSLVTPALSQEEDTNTDVMPIVPVAPEIEVVGLSDTIIEDDTDRPSADTGTNYGGVPAVDENGLSGFLDRTFTINNLGTAPLVLSRDVQLERLQTTSSAGNWFSITSQPERTIPAGESTTFTVRFLPTLRAASASIWVSIASNDSDEGIYDFRIGGLSVAPELELMASGTVIPDGGSLDFGTLEADDSMADQVITISNTASGAFSYRLVLGNGAVTISGPDANLFTLTPPAVTRLEPGMSTAFTIRYSPTDNNVTAEAMVTVNPVNSAPQEFTVSGRKDYGRPVVTLSLSSDTVDEGDVVAVQAMLDVPSIAEIRVTISAVSNSTPPFDVSLSADNVLVIPAGETESENVVMLQEQSANSVYDGERTVTVSGVVETDREDVEDPDSVTLTILDDDTPPMVSISGLSSEETEGTDLTFTLSLSGEALAGNLLVAVTVLETGAVVDERNKGSRTETIRAGQTQHTFIVETIDDEVDEVDSTVTVRIDSDNDPATYTVGSPSEAVVTVTDDDDMADTTAPSLVSITRQAPTTFSINADSWMSDENSLTWRVEFSEDVMNVDTTDFTVTGTTATITNVVPVSGQMDVYHVTASDGNLDNLEGTVVLGFATGQDGQDVQDIADETGNILDSMMPPGVNENSYQVDTIAPMVTIMGVPARSNEPFTATITFSEPVSGFMVEDIMVSNAMLSDFTLVTTSGTDPNSAWAVLVTPTADGMVTLYIAADATTDAVGNGNTAADQVTSIFTAPMINNGDTIAPTVTSVTRQDPMISPTSADRLTWRVEFSEVVANVDTTDFRVSGTTATITNVVPVSGQTDAYDVTASGGDLDTLDGRVILGFADDQNIADGGGNELSDTDPAATNFNFYDLKNTAQDDSTEQQSVRPLEAYLPRFGRTVGEQTTTAVRNRILANKGVCFRGRVVGREMTHPDGHLDRGECFQGRVVGRAISLNESGNAGQASARDRAIFLTLLEQGVDATSPLSSTSPSSWSLTSEEVLLGTSFAFTRDTDAGMSLGFWGRASQSGFDGQSVVGDIDGRVTGVQLGAGWRHGAGLLGLMVSHSRGSGDVAGTMTAAAGEMKSDLIALTPYCGVEVSSTLSLWGAAGLGSGDVTFTPTDGVSTRTDIDWSMLTGGARGALGNAVALSGASLDWIADALWTRTRSDAFPDVPSSAISGDTTRVRAGVEASWAQALDSGSIQTPRLSLGLRHDGGDAETGMGLEIGGGFDWRDASRGLSFGVEGRALALHDDGDYRDWGVGLNFSYDPRPDTQRGFSMTFSQGFGGSSSSGVESLVTSASFLVGFDSSDAGGNWWFVEASHGTSRGLGMVGSPYVRLSGSGTDQMRDLRLGYRLELDASRESDMNLDVWAEPGINAEQPVEASASLQWNW